MPIALEKAVAMSSGWHTRENSAPRAVGGWHKFDETVCTGRQALGENQFIACSGLRGRKQFSTRMVGTIPATSLQLAVKSQLAPNRGLFYMQAKKFKLSRGPVRCEGILTQVEQAPRIVLSASRL